jgi:ubiquinone/menaquinone biosynthesis C-methylase UbiE
MNTHQQASYTGNTPVKPFYLPTRTLQEQSRLTFQHHALRLGLEKNFLAPCSPRAILDVVCGSGAWTAEMGKLFPEASIVGMDLRMPTCPQSSSFQFIEGRTPLSLPFDQARFDYVHQRCLGTVIPTAHWQGIVNELVRVTWPGGWVELMEYGSFVSVGPATEQFCLWWQDVLALRDIDLKAMEHLGQMLQNAGLTHVEQKKLSISLYGGRVGDAMSTNLLALIRNLKPSIIALGIDQKALDQVVAALLKEWQEYKTTYHFFVAYGQRESHRTLSSTAVASSALRPLNARSSQLPYARMVATSTEIRERSVVAESV